MLKHNGFRALASAALASALCLSCPLTTVHAEEDPADETVTENSEAKEKNTNPKRKVLYHQSLNTFLTVKDENDEDETVSFTIEGWFPADFYIELYPEESDEEEIEDMIHSFHAAVFTKDGKEYTSRNDKIRISVSSDDIKAAEEIFVYIAEDDSYKQIEEPETDEEGIRFEMPSGSTVFLTSAPIPEKEAEAEEETEQPE